jgi:hypothetical protein
MTVDDRRRGGSTGVCMRCRLRSSHERGQVTDPPAKLAGTDTLQVVGGIIEDAKHVLDEKVGNGKSHTGKSPHKKLRRVGDILRKRGAAILDRVHPRIAMVKPAGTRMSEDPRQSE